MARIRWDVIGQRRYEAGLDRGVLYPNGGIGVAWNGIVSCDVSEEGGSSTPMYFEGQKTFDYVIPGDFAATLKAITYPDEFLPYDGYEEFNQGMFLANQQKNTFGLSYRTVVANDVKGQLGYKIHILYNLTAIADARTDQTITTNTDPIEFSWKLTSVPEDAGAHRPTAHVIIDTTKVNKGQLQAIEDILYGTAPVGVPHLITMDELLAFGVVEG